MVKKVRRRTKKAPIDERLIGLPGNIVGKVAGKVPLVGPPVRRLAAVPKKLYVGAKRVVGLKK